MKIAIADARALAASLIAGAAVAEQAGKQDFDLTSTLEEQAAQALAGAKEAIDQASQA
jgi:hypothetical protein